LQEGQELLEMLVWHRIDQFHGVAPLTILDGDGVLTIVGCSAPRRTDASWQLEGA
jgi:hypothetical protein